MSGQMGVKSETTWGTPVVVDTFVPVLSAKLSVDEGLINAQGIRAGRRTESPGRLGRRVVGFNVEQELYNGSIAMLLKHAFGAVSTAGTGPYVHTFTPGPHISKSFTAQTGIEDSSATVDPFTASGCKMESWRLTGKVGELCKFSYDATCKDVVTSTGLATASYSTLSPFAAMDVAVSVNGASVASANGFTLTATKGMRNDRHVLGSRLINEQREQAKFQFITEITADFDSNTLFALQAAATQVASVINISNGTESLLITCSGQVIGDPPSLENQGLEAQTIRVRHSHGTSDSSTITAVLTNSEASAA